MKRIYLTLVMLCMATMYLCAQTPQGINYQAVVRNASGAISANSAATFRFSFLEGGPTGPNRYTETKAVTTDAYGMANHVLGSGTTVSGSFAGVDWTKVNYLKVEVNLTGSYVNMGTTKFQSVPYALNAGNTSSVWNTSGNNISSGNSGNVGVGTTSFVTGEKFAVNANNVKLGIYPGYLDNVANANWTTIEMPGAKKLRIWDGLSVSDDMGVGTSAPRGVFDVAGAGDIYLAQSTTAGTGQSIYLPGHIFISPYGGGDISYVQARRSDNSGTTHIQFRTYDNGNLNEPMRIAGNGNVGIGTASPGYKLEVVGGARISGDYVRFCQTSDNSSGNIGVGPDLWNNVKFNINSNQAWALQVEGVAGKTGGGSWAGTSDARLKKDVLPYSEGLAELLKIRPVTYHYNEISGYDQEKEYVGVIAQELQEVAPYMVFSAEFKDSGNEYLHVDNSAMTYMLINSVKEQQATIEALSAKIEAMDATIKALQNK